MGKFYFYYGTMGAGKTSIAINKAYEFKERNKKTYVYVPSALPYEVKIESRNGLSIGVSNELLGDNHLQFIEDNSVIIIDEAQFLSNIAINTLKELSIYHNVMVFCFGLMSDFTGEMFDGTKRIIELADSIREVPCMCAKCEKKAQYNFRLDINNEKMFLDKNKYIPLCYRCFKKAQKIQVRGKIDD